MFNDKKKLIIFLSLIIVVGAIAVIIVVNLPEKKIGYEGLEDKITSAAELYYTDNSKLLPENGEELELSINKLVNEGYLKPINELIEENENCNGKVVVRNVDDEIGYITYLNCGREYNTVNLYDKILEDNPTVTEGKGLYLINGRYVFRGEVTNNYLQIGGNLWKILSISKDNTVRLIFAGNPSTMSVYDDRYNSEKESSYGKNDYSISRLYDNVLELFKDKSLFPKEFKGRLASISACVTPRSETDSDNSFETACSKTIDNQYITLITLGEYINASIDPECKTSLNNECQNYNFLSKFDNKVSWWTITPDKDTSYSAYQISSSGDINNSICFEQSYIRPVVELSEHAIYKSGDGTKDSPYQIFDEGEITIEESE